MLFQGKDGELRIMELGSAAGATHYLEILFCEMNFNGPTSRPRTEETLIMDRGNFDTNAHYIEGDDTPRYAPIPITFSCRLADTINTRALTHWLSGSTQIPNAASGTTTIYSFDGTTTIDGNSLPAFRDTAKQSYRIEVLWDGSNDYGLKYNEVYFPPGQQTITESPDGLVLSSNAVVFGDVTQITAFTSGTSIIAFV